MTYMCSALARPRSVSLDRSSLPFAFEVRKKKNPLQPPTQHAWIWSIRTRYENPSTAYPDLLGLVRLGHIGSEDAL